MNVIILTQYYPPETGAPQNRLHSLAKHIYQQGHTIRVLSALPNYPRNEIFENYRGRLSVKETIDNIPVYRTWIYVGKSRSIVPRLLNYFSFVVTSFFRLLFLSRADFIICESPPLFLGFTAVVTSMLKRSKLVFNVSDLWPESAERLGIVKNRWLLRLSYGLERWIYRHAALISGQTQGIVSNIHMRFPQKKVVWFPNGVDFNFWQREHEFYPWRKELGIEVSEFVVLYAGIIGHAQGLEIIPKVAQLLESSSMKFVIVGDGPVRKDLMDQARQLGLNNIIFIPNQPKQRIPSLIALCDAYLVPLKKLDLFKGAIPSKLFEPLAMRKPILLGVDGEAREFFIDQGKGGLYFEPENAEDLASNIMQLVSNRTLAEQLGASGYSYVHANFDRTKIHEVFLQQVVETSTRSS